MKNFALIGIAGYIAPRHLKAIKETGNHLVAAVDPHDSAGILDKYFYDVSFFTEFERFDRHLEKLRRKDDPQKVDYISICSPNHLHDAHIRFALRIGADAVCEKPLVINPWNLDALQEIENETGNKVYNVLQLRVHDSLKNLKQKLSTQKANSKYDVVLTYITSRGPWYYYSWKGTIEKSGGIATNIGIHFFDMLIWLFGEEISSEVYLSQPNKMSGFLELKNANVKWFLSIDRKDLPIEMENTGNNTYRSVTINEEEIDFTHGFEDLHTQIYKDILTGCGFGIDDARPSIKAAYNIRHAKISEKIKYIHPLALKIIKSTKGII
ncbi:MAG: Gfo/Idh/MocA family oxidoreductase [Ignavibacteriales bacterium]|nr:Gfo/Idh/MocA family oxidoreductase [Ignavibacteriales bacterium]